MPTTIKTLSATDKDSAKRDLTALIQEPSKTKTLLLILGSDAAALKAKQFAQSMLDNDTTGQYVSVQFVHAPNQAFILETLQARPVDLSQTAHTLDWANYYQYTVFALSPTDKLIADVVLSVEIDAQLGNIAAAILCAWGIG